jgi:hypothetical protein
MKWNPEKLQEHFNDHPQSEPCWEEFMGHKISINEYEESSHRTANKRCKIEYLANRIYVDWGEVVDRPQTRHFVDGKLFTTIIVEESKRIKTHFHIHKGGKDMPHKTGSTGENFDILLGVFEDDLHDRTRLGLKKIKFQKFSKSIKTEIQQALRDLEN